VAVNPKYSNFMVNAEADAVGNALNNGYIRIYDGTQPTNADTAVGAQVLLAELRFGADAFPAASAGVLTANAITDDSSANATGTASWVQATAAWDATATERFTSSASFVQAAAAWDAVALEQLTATAAWVQAAAAWDAIGSTPAAGLYGYAYRLPYALELIDSVAAFTQRPGDWRAVIDVNNDEPLLIDLLGVLTP